MPIATDAVGALHLFDHTERLFDLANSCKEPGRLAAEQVEHHEAKHASTSVKDGLPTVPRTRTFGLDQFVPSFDGDRVTQRNEANREGDQSASLVLRRKRRR